MTKKSPALDIYPKFKKLLRPLSEDEKQRLEWSILKDGILDPIKVWPHKDKLYIVDGHNRYDIYQRYPNEIEDGYQVMPLKFEDEDEALEWIIENQLRRRNLNQNERVLYLGRLFEMRKKRRGGLSKTDEAGATAEQIASEQDVSPRTVTRAAEVAQAFSGADKEMQEKFASGKITQAELLRTLKKKETDKAHKKDRLHNDKTAAVAAVGERIKRTITALYNQGEDFLEVCKAIKLDPEELAPELTNLANKFKREFKQAEALTTLVYVGNLCPNRHNETTCRQCKGVQYITEVEFETFKSHFGIEEKKAQAAG